MTREGSRTRQAGYHRAPRTVRPDCSTSGMSWRDAAMAAAITLGMIGYVRLLCLAAYVLYFGSLPW